MNTQRYKELDALRGFAALYVVFFHYTTHTNYSFSVMELGVTGVDLFFVISGFVIFMSINNVKSAKEFVVNRFARLYPTYWASVTFTALVCLAVNYFYISGTTVSTFKYMANMTMFQHYLRAGNLDGTYWTMIIEMVFYIFILLLFRLKLLKHILSISVFMLVVSVFWDMWIESHSDFLYKTIRYIFPLINHFPLFFAGILFYKMINSTKVNYVYYLLLMLCLPVQTMLYNNGGSAQNYIGQWEYSMMLAAYFIVFILFINHKLTFIINKPALFFGKISFALYLIHQYVSIDVIIPILTKEAKIKFWIAAVIAFLVSVGVSTFITFYIEVPLRNTIKSLFSARKITNEIAN